VTEPTARSGFFASPMWQLTAARFKEFYREPIAIFWVYGFPLILALILGTAFQNRPVEKIPVVVVPNDPTLTAKLIADLKSDPRLDVKEMTEIDARAKLRTAKAAIIVLVTSEAPGYGFIFDPNRPDSVMARTASELAILRKSTTVVNGPHDETPNEPGGRYIDFLIPGLLGANVMGGGLWGVGFLIVDMRVKKLLKRLLATPMKRSDFLWSIMISRIILTVVDVVIFLVFASFVFDITVRGSYLALCLMILMGSVCFAGFGMLVASRVTKIESAHGLMNLVILPSYLFSGVFFSSSNFPEWAQPIVSVLPLTALNDGLRAVINDGAGLVDVSGYALIMLVWTVLCYAIGARLFRWL
jgi:ABC-2 type transport system permease protein